MERTSLSRTAATLAVQRAERQHRLIEELMAAAPRACTGEKLAAALEASLRTVQRDVAALCDAGVPIRTKRGKDGGYTLASPRRRFDISLDAGEIAAVIAALVNIGPTTSSTARRVLAKLIEAVNG